MRNTHSNNEAFQAFYDARFDKVYRFFLNRTRHTEEAKDLCQDVFLQVLRHWQQISVSEHPDAYLFSMARNRLFDYYRQSVKRELSLPADWSEISAAADGDQDADRTTDQRMQELLQEVENLPEERKKIFKLKKLQGLSTEEIAEELSLSKRTVENQVYRAVHTLRRQLAQFLS